MSEARPLRRRSARRLGLAALAAFVILAMLGWGAYWYAHLRHYQSTDDAYVAGDLVQITSEVPGTVIALHVDDTQIVRRGAALLELDPADAEVAMAAAEARLAAAVRQVRALIAQAAQGRAQIAEREIALKRAEEDAKRRASLAALGGVSAEELAHARDATAEMAAALDTARRQLDATEAQIAGTTPATNPLVLAAAARLRDAVLALNRTRIAAPLDGVVAKRSAQLGQRVAAGTPLMAVVPLEDVWVDANFKEVQLARMRVGQAATVHADLYGRDVAYHGRVAGFAAGTGGAFALLPPQNASGNWIKIVQRVPVRILLDQQELEAHPLRIGLSVTAEVDLRDVSGRPGEAPLRNRPLPTGAGAADPSIDAVIARIIAENSGAGTTARKEGR